MAFNSAMFLTFFVLFFACYRLLATSRAQRQRLLIAGSLLFYAAWDRRALPILLGVGGATYWLALKVGREEDASRRRRLLAAGIALNLAVLLQFNYLGFLTDGLLHPILTPVGLSFYTLQCISYLTDVERRALASAPSFRVFLAALTFFPNLISGPFVCWPAWLPQFDADPPDDWAAVERGFLLIGLGLFKTAVAGHLALAANGFFRGGGPHSALESWTGMIAFAGGAYGHFAGYSDCAIGAASLLGFSLPANFNAPYAARSPIEFWKRWHISFYTWLYRYLYLPLALNLRAAPYLGLIVTVVLAGLWHGASWAFLRYGVYHALLLTAAYGVATRFPDGLLARLPRWLAAAATFYGIVLGLAIIRCATLAQTWAIWRGLSFLSAPSAPNARAALALGIVVAATAFCQALDHAAARWSYFRRPWAAWTIAISCIAFYFVFGFRAPAFRYTGLQ